MSRMYSTTDDAMIIEAFDEGLSDLEIAERFSEIGVKRSAHSIRDRRSYLRLFRRVKNAMEKAVAAEPEDPARERVICNVTADEAFCAAMREHHPDRETPLRKVTIPSRMVPLRSQPAPLYSSTGYMVP